MSKLAKQVIQSQIGICSVGNALTILNQMNPDELLYDDLSINHNI